MEALIIVNFMDKDLPSLNILVDTLNKTQYPYFLSMRFQGCSEETIEQVRKAVKPKYWQIGENIGNAQGLNLQIKCNLDKINNGFVVVDPDIKMTDGWLKATIEAEKAIENTGMIGYKWRPIKGRNSTKNGIKINKTGCIFGTKYISAKAFEQTGYFLELSLYGQWDGEYRKRVESNNLVCYYLQDFPSVHTPSPKDGEVRAFKNEQIKIANKELKKYKEITYFNPYE
jgi:GT2 family glycosyltransferase